VRIIWIGGPSRQDVSDRRPISPNGERTQDAAVVDVPPSNAAQLAETPPLARVVLTFSAAKALKIYLDEVIPRFEAVRKSS
jgi:hypothetical protein